MIPPLSPEVIEILLHGSTDDRLSALKSIKNVLVGHDQRKEAAIKLGIIEPLANILSPPGLAGKRRVGNISPISQSQEWTADEELQLQAAIVTGSLAAGGQAFLAPLCAAGMPHILVRTLAGEPSSRLATAVLQALHALAAFVSTGDGHDVESEFWPAVITAESVGCFHHFLKRSTQPTNPQLKLVAGLISMAPESSRAFVAQSGILDTLAAILTWYTVSTGNIAYGPSHQGHPVVLPPASSVASILDAISNLISDSAYRTHCFILAPAIRDITGHLGTRGIDAAELQSRLGARHGFLTSEGPLLPPLHVPATRTVSHSPASNHFPAMNSLHTAKQPTTPHPSTGLHLDIDHANAVCSWLIVLVRSMRGADRLAVLTLLAYVTSVIEQEPMGTVNKTEWQQKTRERERQLALLAVPLTVQLVQQACESKVSDPTSRKIHEKACSALAVLIRRNKELQIAAVEAGAIKYVCPILKRSFDNVTFAKPAWSAKSRTVDAAESLPARRMGSVGLPTEILHAMQCRKSALEAIAALSAQEDLHRKAIIDIGVISFIIDSLKPFSPNAITDAITNRMQLAPKDGNLIGVVLAACQAAQSMSRSVTVLRTSLMDGGIAKPVIQLLRHPSIDVQIAATDVCCNLAPDFSPLREDLTEAEVVKTLVVHARSSSPALRLSSLWALKHLMCLSPKELKVATLEELGTGWLVDIIQGAPQDPAAVVGGGGVSVGLSSANAAGEQVDLLNPSSMDVDEPSITTADRMDDDVDVNVDDGDEDGEVMFDEASRTHYQSSQLRSTLNHPPPAFNKQKFLSTIWDIEQNEDYAARRDETTIQVQALDFLRNLINGDDCAALSDHIMSQIGNAKVYELLTSKLSPILQPDSTRPAVYHPTELILSTIHIFIHLANASTRHRGMLIAQTPLLEAMLPHFNHVDHNVRCMMVWAVTSLTYVEDDSDRRDARQRWVELQAVGIDLAVRALVNDPVLDVRERVRTAIRHFEKMA